MGAMLTTGFQATNIALAIEEINRMVRCHAMLWVYHKTVLILDFSTS